MNAALIPLVERLVGKIAELLEKRKKIREVILPLIEEASQRVMAGDPVLDNATRRAFVLKQLMQRGMSESNARALIEAGLKLYKKIQAKAAKKAARKARRNS